MSEDDFADYPSDLDELLDDAKSYLAWQKKLKHQGVPASMFRARQNAMKPDNTASAVADTAREEIMSRFSHNKSAKDLPSSISTNPETPETPETQKPQSVDISGHGKTLSLEEIKTELGDCERCKLFKTRNNIVFGDGNPKARILFIGEGPGKDEDMQGLPFVGRAGKLLDRWIELGMGIPRKDVYIGNIVKCRPPNNRDPEKDEVAACIGFIKKQVQAIKPEAIVLLGRVPMMHVLGEKKGITKVHGNWYEFEGIKTMPIFHPSYCLRPPLDEKRKLVWGDLKKLMKELDIPVPQKNKK